MMLACRQRPSAPPRPASRLRLRLRSARAAAAAPASAAPGDASTSAVDADVPPDYGERFPPPRSPRRAGILLHPTSLPSPHGVGDLGPEAYAFVDWLAAAGMQVWQVLPLVPPDAEYFSPYSGRDASCGNPNLVSLQLLAEEGLLDATDLAPLVAPVGAATFASYAAAAEPLLAKAAARLLAGAAPGCAVLRRELRLFRAEPAVAAWLEPAALFSALEASLPGLLWWQWPAELRHRQPATVAAAAAEHAASIDRFCAVQFLFHRQWTRLKAYANASGVSLMGDMPIYVGGHSADVWCNPHLWQLGADGAPTAVSGTPPDAFSSTGQLWGSPLYRWSAHAEEGYAWWAARVGRALTLHDEVRIDHFRGLAGYWSVPADAPTALFGCWKQGPGLGFFQGLEARLGRIPLVAEDLGVITADVVALRDALGAPGMAVLQFGWDGNPSNPHLPHSYAPNSFVYPGTHDNDTLVGWYAAAPPDQQARFDAYLGTDGSDPAWDAIRMCLLSCARTTVVALQDVLRLGNEGRMNTPGVAGGNWAWRVGPAGVFGSHEMATAAAGLRAMVHQYDRLRAGAPAALPGAAEGAAAAPARAEEPPAAAPKTEANAPAPFAAKNGAAEKEWKLAAVMEAAEE